MCVPQLKAKDKTMAGPSRMRAEPPGRASAAQAQYSLTARARRRENRAMSTARDIAPFLLFAGCFTGLNEDLLTRGAHDGGAPDAASFANAPWTEGATVCDDYAAGSTHTLTLAVKDTDLTGSLDGAVVTRASVDLLGHGSVAVATVGASAFTLVCITPM